MTTTAQMFTNYNQAYVKLFEDYTWYHDWVDVEFSHLERTQHNKMRAVFYRLERAWFFRWKKIMYVNIEDAGGDGQYKITDGTKFREKPVWTRL